MAKGMLRNILSGGVWTQERAYRAGLAPSSGFGGIIHMLFNIMMGAGLDVSEYVVSYPGRVWKSK
eukprot:5761522-Karenia_brevis.AAC.1